MRVYLIVFLFSLSLTACKKDTTEPVDTFKSSANAKLNGKDWSPNYADAVYYYYNEGRFSLLLDVYEGEIKKMSVGIYNIYLDKKLNIIHERDYNQGIDSCSGLLGLMDDDAALADYYVLTGPDEENFVDISKYDPAKRQVEGTFSVSFYKKIGETSPDYGDTIRITDGTFKVKIRKE